MVSAYRLRRTGREFLVIDRDSLVRMAAQGQVRTGDEVWFDERWQPVGALPELKGRLDPADPWDAWESGADAEAVLAQFQEPEEIDAVPLDVPAPVAPLPEASRGTSSPRTSSPRASAVEEAPLPEIEAEPVTEEAGGQLIDFPKARTRPVVLPPMPPNTPRAPAPLVRASRVFGMFMAGGALLSIGYLWMVSVGSMHGVRAPVARPEATTEPVPLHPTTATAVVDPYRDLLASLRARLPQDVQAVHASGDLEDALLIELQNLETGIDSVTAEVTRWTGPKNDKPRQVTIVVTFRGVDNLDRDLASFGLVLGRYMRAYSMEVESARVVFHTDAGDQGRDVDAAAALALYNGTLPLKSYLAQ